MGTRKYDAKRFALLALALPLFACGDDSDPAPTGPGLVLDSGIPNLDSSVTPQPDATTPGNDAGAANGDCKGANGCFSCKPSTNEQLLNACATGCVTFDNATRLPANAQPGRLPPL